MKAINTEPYARTMGMAKVGQMSGVNPKILDANAKKVLIQTEFKVGNKTTTVTC